MAFKTVAEILKLVQQWEERLNSFYDIMEEYLKDGRSRETAVLLQKEQTKAIKMLKDINFKEYGRAEYVQNVPDYGSEEVIPHFEISADSSPKEVFETILEYEEKLEKFYTHLRDIVTFEKSRDLLDMLVQFKMGQIKKIKACMDSLDLAF